MLIIRTAILPFLILSACQCVEPSTSDAGQDSCDAGACATPALACEQTCQGCCGINDGGCSSGFSDEKCGRNGSSCANCGTGTCINGVCEEFDGGCFAPPVPGSNWATGTCPDAGCPSGSMCLRGTGESASTFGCLPIQSSCAGATPSCACMGCVCGIACQDTPNGFVCDNGTISTREMKQSIRYLSSTDREKIAAETLLIPLATYEYRIASLDQGRRLGFIIEDQPLSSPAVRPDRRHVDEYGYSSMLLATIQSQAKLIAELQERVRRLEQRR
jgi:hypothetical protein